MLTLVWVRFFFCIAGAMVMRGCDGRGCLSKKEVIVAFITASLWLYRCYASSERLPWIRTDTLYWKSSYINWTPMMFCHRSGVPKHVGEPLENLEMNRAHLAGCWLYAKRGSKNTC